MSVVLRAANVCKSVGQTSQQSARMILQDVNLTASAGEFLSVLGPSGSGKTTLLQCLSGIQTVTSGQVTVLNEDLDRLSATRQAILRRTVMSFIFQSYNLLPALPVIDNIALPLRLAHQPVDQSKIEQFLKMLNFGADINRLPVQLSGGEQQKVAIVRALMMHAQIIFADEPTGALDSVSRELIFEQLRKLTDEGVCVIMVTHDIELAAKTDRAVILRDGHLVNTFQSPNEMDLLAALHEEGAVQND